MFEERLLRSKSEPEHPTVVIRSLAHRVQT
jgi:hypothetical protein